MQSDNRRRPTVWRGLFTHLDTAPLWVLGCLLVMLGCHGEPPPPTLSATGVPAAQQGPKLVGTGAVGPAQQGMSVALSADGNTAVVGGSSDSGNVGAAWVYTRTAGVWTQQGPKLVGTGAVGPAFQGISVALSVDGNTAVVGGVGDSHFLGAAWVYTRTAGVWTQQGPKLVGADAVIFTNGGIAVALSADGNTAVVGGPFDDGEVGAAWVYTR